LKNLAMPKIQSKVKSMMSDLNDWAKSKPSDKPIGNQSIYEEDV